MQSPTPPTKPIPPTPPSMKKSSELHPAEIQPPATAKSQTLLPSKEQSSPPAPNVTSESTSNIPPMTTSGSSNQTSQTKTSETTIPPTTQLPKTNSSSFGFNLFFIIILLASLILVGVHWLKRNNQKKQSTVDYSTESSDDIVNLILSQNNPEPTPQVLPKIASKKSFQKTESPSKPKGGFEVRI